MPAHLPGALCVPLMAWVNQFLCVRAGLGDGDLAIFNGEASRPRLETEGARDGGSYPIEA